MSGWDGDESTAGAVMGILASINIIVEALVAKNSPLGDSIARLLAHKIDELRKAPEGVARGMIEMLEQIRNPLVSEERKATRRLLNESGGEA